MKRVTAGRTRAWLFYKNGPVSKRIIIACAIGIICFMITASSFKAIAPAEGQTSPPPREGGCTVGRDNYGIVSCFNGEAIRSVTPETIAEIQKDIPSGARIKVWKTLHDGATAKTAQDLSSALTNAGYKVIGVGDFFGIPYFKGINAEKNEEVYSIYVGDPRL